jgi:hypothetical protein
MIDTLVFDVTVGLGLVVAFALVRLACFAHDRETGTAVWA